MQEELLAHIQKKGDNATSDAPAAEGRKMTPEQIRSRRKATVNNIAERQMFGFNYKNKIKNK